MLKTGEVFNPSDMTDIETSQKKRIEYIKNNFKNAFNQLMRTELSSEEILAFLPIKSTDSPLKEQYTFVGVRGHYALFQI